MTATGDSRALCDRCYADGPDISVRASLPCCPVPLCDRCAKWHQEEVAEYEAYRLSPNDGTRA